MCATLHISFKDGQGELVRINLILHNIVHRATSQL